MSSLIANQLPDVLSVFPHSVGDVNLRRAVSREGSVQSQDPIADKLLQLFAIDVVFSLVPAAEEKMRLADLLPFLLLPGAFLDEASERG